MNERSALFLVGGRLDSYKAYTQNFLNFIRLAREKGYKATVSGLKKTDKTIRNETPEKTIVFMKSPWGILRLIITNFNELISRRYDVVVLGSLYTWTFILYYPLLKLRRSQRVVYYMQDPVPESRRLMRNNKFTIPNSIAYSLAMLCEKLACKLSNVILLPSKGCLKILKARNKLSGKKIMFAYNIWGLHRLMRKANNGPYKLIEKRYGITGKTPVILYSGKLQRKIRGIEIQLHILRKLVKNHPKALFVLTGSGEESWFTAKAEKLGVLNNVVFTGVLTDEELKAVYLSSDITILPPVDYLLPAKFFEALYMDLVPIVWEKSTDMVEILGKDAITYDGTEEGLLKTLEHVTNNLSYYKKRTSSFSAKILGFHRESEKTFSIALAEE